MRRRNFIALFGSAATWPLLARAQQHERVRRIGAIMGFRENDTEGSLWLSSFTRALLDLGWTEGHNLRSHVRWSASNVEREHLLAKELVALQPDVILAHGTPVTAALEESPCQPGAVHTWHLSEVAAGPSDVRCWRQLGQDMLNLSSSESDP
jgi:putative ABC transport system substrate-binding protein